MDSTAIERYATNAVEDSIHETNILQAEISRGDKSPSWDGCILVYKSSSKKKNNLDGKVEVQVKGVVNNDHAPEIISYAAEVADLKNYLHNGGAIYFVVYIHEQEPAKRKIYYETLTPVKLKKYLDGAEQQTTKTIKLTAFPTDKNRKNEIIVNFLNDRRKQISHVETGFISLEEITKNGSRYTQHIEVLGYGDADTKPSFSALFENDAYIYATTEYSNTPIPVDSPILIMEIIEDREEKVSVGDTDYYEDCKIIRSSEGLSVKMGDSVILVLGKLESASEEVPIQTKITLSPYVRKREKDIQFVLAFVCEKQIKIGNLELRLNPTDGLPSDFIPMMQKRLTADRRIIEMLNILDVDEDLNTHELNADQKRSLDILVKAFVDRKDMPNIRSDEPVMNLILAPNIALKLIIKENENRKSSIFNFFDAPGIGFFHKNANGDHLITSPYSALAKDEYRKFSNVNFGKILASYQNCMDKNPEIINITNSDLLKMLTAYDENPDVRLLSAAKDIAHWILTDGKNNIGSNISILNYLQVIKRERSFEKDEIAQLYKIVESDDANEQEKIGAYLLLDSQLLAEMHWGKLSDEEKKSFKGFPIYKFWSPSTTTITSFC